MEISAKRSEDSTSVRTKNVKSDAILQRVTSQFQYENTEEIERLFSEFSPTAYWKR